MDWTRGKNGRGTADEQLTKRADAFRVEEVGSRRRRPRLRWEDCVKRGLAGVGGEWGIKARDGEVEMVGGDDSETGSAKKKGQKSTTILGTSLTPDFRDKEESNNTYPTTISITLAVDANSPRTSGIKRRATTLIPRR